MEERRCWASRAFALSRMAARTPTRSRIPSALQRNLQAEGSTSALKRNCATVTREPPRQRRTDMLRTVLKMLFYWRATLVGQAILPAAAFQAAVPDGAPIFKLGRRRLKAGGSQDWLRDILLVLIAGLAPMLGAVEDPVHWTLTFDSKSVPPGSKFIGHMTAKIDPGWHLYSLTTPRPPIATTAALADNPAVASFKVYQPKPIVKEDPTFKVNTETFGDEVTFLYEIELKKDAPAGPLELTAQARYQCCNDTSCLPPKKKTAVATIIVDPSATAEKFAIPARYAEFRKPA